MKEPKYGDRNLRRREPGIPGELLGLVGCQGSIKKESGPLAPPIGQSVAPTPNAKAVPVEAWCRSPAGIGAKCRPTAGPRSANPGRGSASAHASLIHDLGVGAGAVSPPL